MAIAANRFSKNRRGSCLVAWCGLNLRGAVSLVNHWSFTIVTVLAGDGITVALWLRSKRNSPVR